MLFTTEKNILEYLKIKPREKYKTITNKTKQKQMKKRNKRNIVKDRF